MRRALRHLLLLATAVLAVGALGACGNKQDEITHSETEGNYLDLGGLKYQVQISRQLNAADREDKGYLIGLSPQDRRLPKDQTWYGIFIRVQNDGDDPQQAAQEFEIRDTQGNVFKPLNLDPKFNLFAYKARPVTPGTLLPILNSPASDNTIRGALLLFKVKTDSLYNRPLELHIANSREGQGEAVIDLDV